MGGTPTRKHTKSRRNKGRAHFALKKQELIPCQKCRALKLPHRVCLECGFFKGKEEPAVLRKLDKKDKKRREKVLKQTEAK